MMRATVSVGVAAMFVTCVVACSSGDGASNQPCNGDPRLCSRRFDEVTFAATHNAHAARDYGYPSVNANQISGFEQQLADGVRAFLIDVYEEGEDSSFCHGYCTLASTPHVEGLQTFKTFLEQNTREVITFIYEDHMPAARIADDFARVGLDALVYTHEPGEPWPTLSALIEANTRLIVTAENAEPPPAWLHHVWDVAWDTPYDFQSTDQFSCQLNRGSRDNDLFLINHWLGDALGLPSEAGALEVNAHDVLLARAQACADETGDVPNFIAVDFYEHGDLLDVVAALNGELTD